MHSRPSNLLRGQMPPKIKPGLSKPHPFQALQAGRGSRHLHGFYRLALTVKFRLPTHPADDGDGMLKN
jgi:hypothetical protein